MLADKLAMKSYDYDVLKLKFTINLLKLLANSDKIVLYVEFVM